mmetsp:Transcript_1790/g.3734  ORF Transcript_1790/g.3734 Transcript_1790/m.3734 type:complete len:98 (+) Transcript_1790:160-453(+)
MSHLKYDAPIPVTGYRVRWNAAPVNRNSHERAFLLTGPAIVIDKMPFHLQSIPWKPNDESIGSEADAHRVILAPERVLLCPVKTCYSLEAEIKLVRT